MNNKYLDVSLICGDGINSMHFYYERISTLLDEKNGKKLYLGDYKNKICRYCSKDSNQTTFKKKAHIIPEFMGNKYCFSNFECDVCNDRFGNWEDSLANFAGIYNTLSTLKGKRGFAKFKNPQDEFELFAESENVIISRTGKTGNEDKNMIRDLENGKMLFDIKQPSYIPQDAFKALMKIALSMLDNNDFNKYKSAIDWINRTESIDYSSNPLFNVYRKIGGEKRFLKPWAILYKKRKNHITTKSPQHTLLLFYGIIQYQIFLPFHEDDVDLLNYDKITLPIENHLMSFKLNENNERIANIDRVSLGSNSKVNRDREKFSFGFKEKK
jgi:hypothetical protein